MKIKIVYVVTNTRKCGPIQQTLNNIKYLDRDIFEPYLITIYPEDNTSQLSKFLPYVKHIYVPTSKLEIMFNRTRGLKKTLKEIAPDVIHSLGVFPDYAISKIGCYKQVVTLRNYMWDDYPVRLGFVRGNILCQMQKQAIKRASKVVTCSYSLISIYKESKNWSFEAIPNGVDTTFFKPNKGNKEALRKRLLLPEGEVIFVYSGPIITRKNHEFLIRAFADSMADKKACLLILGDGALYEKIKHNYQSDKVIFKGNVLNILDYLQASDIYVSSSLSEGLPNSVLEGIATGLPVLLSDIPQHKELFLTDSNIGTTYNTGSINSLKEQLVSIYNKYLSTNGEMCNDVNTEKYSAKETSLRYQLVYKNIVEK